MVLLLIVDSLEFVKAIKALNTAESSDATKIVLDSTNIYQALQRVFTLEAILLSLHSQVVLLVIVATLLQITKSGFEARMVLILLRLNDSDGLCYRSNTNELFFWFPFTARRSTSF